MAGVNIQGKRILPQLPAEELERLELARRAASTGSAQSILDGGETDRSGIPVYNPEQATPKGEVNPNPQMFEGSEEQQMTAYLNERDAEAAGQFDPEASLNGASVENFGLTQTGQGDTGQGPAVNSALDFDVDLDDMSEENNTTRIINPNEGVIQKNALPKVGVGTSQIQAKPFDENEYMDDGTGNNLPENRRREVHNKAVKSQQAAARRNNRNFQYETREQLKEAYAARGTGPKELDRLLSFAHGLGKTINENMGVSFTTTEGTNVREGDSIFEILSKEFNAEPLSIVNATAETAAFVFLALQNKATAVPGQAIDMEDDTDSGLFLEMMGVKDQSYSSNGNVGIELEALEGLLASQVNLKLREAEGTPSGTGANIAGKILAKSLEAQGYIKEIDFQPLDFQTGAPKGPKVRSYEMTPRGANIADNFSKLGQGQRNRVSAQGASGNTLGPVSDINKTADIIRAGKKTKEGSKLFDNYTMTLANSSKMFSSDVLAFDNILLTFAVAENTTGASTALKTLASEMLNITPFVKKSKLNAIGQVVENKVKDKLSPKAQKVRRELLAAVELSASTPIFKTPFFVDPTSRRPYNYTFNANPQESRVHRGALQGVPININLNIDVNLNSNAPIISPERFADFDKWAKSDTTTITDNARFTGSMLAIANLVLADTRNFTDKDALRRLTGAELTKRAKMGGAIKKLIDANPQAVDGKELANVSLEGLEQADVKDIMFILNSIGPKNGTSDEKEHGNIIQGYLGAYNIVEAIKRGDSSIRLSIPNAADMASAGRMLIAADIGDMDTISRVGLGLNSVVGYGRNEDSEIFPLGNPRYYFAETIISIMSQKLSAPQGYNDVDFTPELSALVSDTISDVVKGPKGAKFADMMAKKTLMITDYGKPASQNTAEVADFIKKMKRDYNDVYLKLVENFETNEYDADQIPRFFEEACYEATREVVDTRNSRAQKQMTEMFALFNEMPTYEGIRGADIRIGHKSRAIIPGAEMLLTWEGLESAQRFQMKGDLVDDPLKASAPKWIVEAQKWVTPGIGSAVVNSLGAAMGHYRETAINAIGMEAVMAKFGPGVFVDQVYDSVTLDFLQAPVFQRAVHGSAIKEVINFNDAEAYNQAFLKMMKKKLGDIRAKGSVVLGEKGEYPGFTAKFDEEWNNLNEPIDTSSVKNRRIVERTELGKASTEAKLRQAHKDGIWSPPPYTGKTMSDGFVFLERGVDETSRSVDATKFLNLIHQHVMTPQFKKNRAKWSEDTNQDKKIMLEELEELIAAGFMKSGRNKA